jgi:hypothetical protein
MVEDIRDGLLDYQVGDHEAYVTFGSLKFGALIDGPATGDI